jgi:hypothetical protein
MYIYLYTHIVYLIDASIRHCLPGLACPNANPLLDSQQLRSQMQTASRRHGWKQLQGGGAQLQAANRPLQGGLSFSTIRAAAPAATRRPTSTRRCRRRRR